jgi:hypothetical protein
VSGTVGGGSHSAAKAPRCAAGAIQTRVGGQRRLTSRLPVRFECRRTRHPA